MIIYLATWMLGADQRFDMQRERVGERLFSYFEVMGKEPKLNESLKEITDATEQRNDS